MSFDIAERFPDKAWLNDVAQKLHAKMTYAAGEAAKVDFIPYTTENGKYKENFINWWTNGFWPASMWQMYLATKDEVYREAAIRAEKMMDEALANYDMLDHDVGFLWLIHSGVHYALDGNKDSYARTMKAAQHLACRFNPNGFIRAWNSAPWNGYGAQGRAIIDCMMNLPLLYWASRQLNDPRFMLVAMRHADTSMKYFVRGDGSCNHIVDFDPMTGEFVDNPGGQGYESGSSWSRGQAWALYGFTLSYINTGKKEYLDTAKRVANYFISQITDDYLPRCDFRQPAAPELKDDAAGTIAAAGLLALCQQVPELEAQFYYDAAVRLLRALESKHVDWELDNPALLTHCTSAYHDEKGYHITMDYADYYFIEAINMLRGQKLSFWYPDK